MKPDYYCKEREVFTMAFVKKTWKDRIAEFPTRRRLTKEDNTSELVTVAREEGTLSQEGDAFSAENMNDLENRIDAEFTEVNGKLTTPTIANNSEYIIGYYNGKPVYRKWYISDNANLPTGLTIIDKSINMQNSELFSFNGVFWQGKYYTHAITFEYVPSGNKSYIFSIRVSKDGVLIQNNNYPGVNKYRLYVDYCAK